MDVQGKGGDMWGLCCEKIETAGEPLAEEEAWEVVSVALWRAARSSGLVVEWSDMVVGLMNEENKLVREQNIK